MPRTGPAEISMRQLLIALLLLSAAAPAAAQLVLPGAVAPTPEGARGAAPQRQSAAKPKRRKRPDTATTTAAPAAKLVPARTVPAAALAGQTLYRFGRDSQISFDLRDKALVVSHLTLAGTDDKGEDCRIDVSDLPLATTDQGQPNGTARIDVALPACPISFDVLDGAALATGEHSGCAFQTTHCKVDPTGLWGPRAAALGPERDKLIERERARAEAAVRTNFKRLLTTTKDRPTIVGYARDQAQFSSTREEVCRAYAGETKHGFCSTRLTEARAASLRAKADIEQVEKDKRKKKRHAG